MRLAPLLVLASVASAQRHPDAGLAAFRQACLDATTDAVVLNVAAHPDDEAGRTVVILRRKHGLRTVTAYTTYGDGGQNAVGREIGPELAAIRVRETLAAASISGVQVRWLGMEDFGFSKTREETLAVWGEERLLTAMRQLVREIDPDVVFTNHSLDRGHGHHRASRWAIGVALEELAAETGRVVPLYVRTSLENSQLAYDPAELDRVRGETYGRQAHRAWVQHVTQGPWGPHNPLRVRKDYWRMVHPAIPATNGAEDASVHGAGAAAPIPTDPFDYIRTVIDRPGFAEACTALALDPDQLRAELEAFREDRPVAAHVGRARDLLPRLRAVRARLGQSVEAAHTRRHLDRRIDALQRVLLAGTGISVETWLAQDRIPAGGRGRVRVAIHGDAAVADVEVRHGESVGRPMAAQPPSQGSPRQGSLRPASVRGGSAPSPGASTPATLANDKFELDFTHVSAASEDGDESASGPEPAWLDIDVSMTLGGLPIHLRRSLVYTPVPPLELRWDRNPVMVPAGQKVERIFSLRATNHGERPIEEAVRLMMGIGLQAEAIPGRVSLSRQHPEQRLLVRVVVDGAEMPRIATLKTQVNDTRADLTIVPVAVTVDPELRIGLVRGPDDTLENALQDLGVSYRVLDVDRLAVSDLREFTALVFDIRAYHHHRDLSEHKERILRFCRSGGRVVVLYHKSREWNESPGHPLLAPFPMHVSNQRVTEEDAEVVLLEPEHRLWNHPHRIGPGDFEGWVQERGLNFPDKWDAAWTPLMAMRDSGEKEPLKGALLFTDYGKGQYLYCSLALYRQLRRGHGGAARILLNLLTQ